MRVLVTGGAGFIGSHLVEALADSGHDVAVIDIGDIEDIDIGDTSPCADLDRSADVRRRIVLERVDIRDREACASVFAAWRPEAVVHLAAVASPARSIAEPELAHDVNVNGAFNVLEAARRSAARRFVFSSSAAVYGPQPALPSHESDTPAPASPYAAQKLAGEHFAAVYRGVWGLETVVLRLFNVFGERQRADSANSGVISIVTQALRTSGKGMITGDGEQSRDFIHVADVVRVISRAALGEDPGLGPFNVGRGESMSMRRLYRMLAERLNAPDMPLFAPERAGDVRHSRADIGRMLDHLGIRPTVSFDTGIERLLAWQERSQ